MKNGKRHRIHAIVICAFLFAAATLRSSDTGARAFILVINPGSPSSEKLMKGWQPAVTRGEIAEWGAGRGYAVEEDREPVVDNIAAYVSPRGSSVTIEGLERGVRYRAWIDFVRVRYGAAEPPSTLKIAAKAPGMEKRPVVSLALRDCMSGYHYVDIPADATSRGSVELLFEEYAPRPGNWGVWDIVVTSGLELPARGSLTGNDTINLEINDRIVQ